MHACDVHRVLHATGNCLLGCRLNMLKVSWKTREEERQLDSTESADFCSLSGSSSAAEALLTRPKFETASCDVSSGPGDVGCCAAIPRPLLCPAYGPRKEIVSEELLQNWQ